MDMEVFDNNADPEAWPNSKVAVMEFDRLELDECVVQKYVNWSETPAEEEPFKKGNAVFGGTVAYENGPEVCFCAPPSHVKGLSPTAIAASLQRYAETVRPMKVEKVELQFNLDDAIKCQLEVE